MKILVNDILNKSIVFDKASMTFPSSELINDIFLVLEVYSNSIKRFDTAQCISLYCINDLIRTIILNKSGVLGDNPILLATHKYNLPKPPQSSILSQINQTNFAINCLTTEFLNILCLG